MGTLPSYPPAVTPLVGDEAVAIWQNDKQHQVLPSALWGPLPVVDLFVNLPNYTSPAVVTAITTGGHSAAGIGRATYIADVLATAGLAATFPNFCKADKLGRYFRLSPGANGFLGLSQAGAVPLTGLGNAQPYAQALVDYARAIGCEHIQHDMPAPVDLWCPPRASSAADGTAVAFALDGHHLLVQNTLHIEGLPGGSVFNYRGPTGGPMKTDFQIVGGAIWRGPLIKLMGGTQYVVDANNILKFSARNVKFDGGTLYDGVTTASTPLSPAGIDLTNKGLDCNSTSVFAIEFDNVEITGTQGEGYYFSPAFTSAVSPNGTPDVPQRFRQFRVNNNSQSSFNPSVGGVDGDDCAFGASRAACEILGGTGGRLNNCRFYDAQQISITGGPANGVLYNYQNPTRDLTKSPPWFDLTACRTDNVRELLIGNYIRFEGQVTDGFFTLDCSSNGSLISTYINASVIMDRYAGTYALAATAPPTLTTQLPGAPAGTYMAEAEDVHIRLRMRRTPAGRANGLHMSAFGLSGFFNQESCKFTLEEGDGCTSIVQPAGTLGSLPLVEVECATNSQEFNNGPDGQYPQLAVSGAIALMPSGPVMGLGNLGAAGNVPVTIPNPFTAPYDYASGQQLLIVWNAAFTTPGTVYTFDQRGTGMQLKGNRRFYQWGDWLLLEYDVSIEAWVEIEYFSQQYFLNGSGSITPASLLTNTWELLGTITVPNAAIGDFIDGLSCSVVTGGIEFQAEYSAANTASIYARDDKGSTWNPGAITFAITGHKA